MAAGAVRRSLKDEIRLRAESRGVSDLKVATWKVRVDPDDKKKKKKKKIGIDLKSANTRRGIAWYKQDGEQSESKSLNEVNKEAAAEASK